MVSDRDIDMFKELVQSSPPDVIYLNRKSDKMLMDLWSVPKKKSTGKEQVILPSDIFNVGTIPLLDCKIVIDERDEYPENGGIIEFRVKVLTEYQDYLNNAALETNCAALVGIFQVYCPGGWIAIPLCCKPLTDGIAFHNEMGVYKNGKLTMALLDIGIAQGCFECMSTWYGVQIALLHPVVQNVFRNPKCDVMKDTNRVSSKSSKRKPKVKYIKKHIINEDELKQMIYGERNSSKSYNRKALIWYVIGHWRTCANGKRVFVRPCWKGALRDTKIVESREREVLISSI